MKPNIRCLLHYLLVPGPLHWKILLIGRQKGVSSAQHSPLQHSVSHPSLVFPFVERTLSQTALLHTPSTQPSELSRSVHSLDIVHAGSGREVHAPFSHTLFSKQQSPLQHTLLTSHLSSTWNPSPAVTSKQTPAAVLHAPVVHLHYLYYLVHCIHFHPRNYKMLVSDRGQMGTE